MLFVKILMVLAFIFTVGTSSARCLLNNGLNLLDHLALCIKVLCRQYHNMPPILYYTILHYTILYYTILLCSATLCYGMLGYAIVYHATIYIILRWIGLQCIVLAPHLLLPRCYWTATLRPNIHYAYPYPYLLSYTY